LLAICVAASADAHQANISTARVEALPQRFVAVELALKSSDVDQRSGTHASSGAPWRDEQGARRCRKPGLASAGDTARDGEVGAGVGRDRVHGRLPRYRQSRGAAKHVRVLQRTLKDTRNRFEASQVTATDVAQSETLLAAGEASLHAAESTLMTTRANYRRITSSKGSFPNRQHDFPVVLALAIGTTDRRAKRVGSRSDRRSGRSPCGAAIASSSSRLGLHPVQRTEAMARLLCWAESIPAQGQPFAGIGLPLPQLTASLRDRTEGGALL
jgi:hypothetical protein